MKTKIILWFLVLVWFLKGGVALAYFPLLNEKEKPYEITPVADNFEEGIQYLGELKGDPQTYEIIIRSEKKLVVSLVQLESKNIIPLSLIVVRKNDRGGGVSEIGRISGKETVWQKEKPKSLGLTVLRSEELENILGEGIYRLEVSAPDNLGKYVLVFSNLKPTQSYFKEVKNVRLFQSFFGKSFFSLFKSKYIFGPFLILLIIFGVFYQRQQEKMKKA